MSLGFVPHNKQTEILGSKPEPEDNFMLLKENAMRKICSQVSLFILFFFVFRNSGKSEPNREKSKITYYLTFLLLCDDVWLLFL